MRHDTPRGAWEALAPAEVIQLMAGFERRWWFAGGYALEAFAGRSWRDHDDIDLCVFREDAPALREHLAAWSPHAADPPGHLRPWPPGEILPASVHDIWVRADDDGPWRFQVMIDESFDAGEDGRAWIYRRDPRIARRESTLTFAREGARWLAPEVQLLYKAKGLRRKDEHDFAEVLPLLEGAQTIWLRGALHLAHPWLARL